MDTAARDRLFQLLNAHGPSGREREAADLWASMAAEFATVERDQLGNAMASVGPDDAPTVLLLGHIDQIGVIITHIEDEGVLRIRGLGGWDPRVLVGQPVSVRTSNGDIPGVIGSVPIHLQKGDERTSGTQMKDLWIDIGATDGEHARSLVRVGDDAIVGSAPIMLAGTRLTSRALDDRVGAWAALEALRRVQAGSPKVRVVATGCVLEETLGDGARLVTDRVAPAVAIVIDVTHAADVPMINKGDTGPQALGKGPVVTRGLGLDEGVVAALETAAKANNIVYGMEAMPGGSTHTDVDNALHAVRSLRAALIGIPLRHMHSPAEVCDLNDLEGTAALLAAYCLAATPESLA
ncbi:MAG: M20/M25/M40 family metallo-hydrolase [Actinobacteria bacterium]|nr:M20/M25/M40 family metallo-hydrolase [Actinomycetota bacterium]